MRLPVLEVMVPIALVSLLGLGSACSDGVNRGACIVTEYPINGVAYSENHDLCTLQGECDTYCAGTKGNPAVGACKWDPHGLCDEQPKSIKPPEVCAVSQSIVCGGGGDNFKTICDPDCGYPAGSSDYDPETDCLTQYRSSVGHGHSCDEAIADLNGTRVPPPAPTQTAAPAPTQTPPTTTDRCQAAATDTACGACGKQYCCAETKACGSDSNCLALAKCVVGCTTQECADACSAKYPGSVDAYNAFVTCGTDHCGSACSS